MYGWRAKIGLITAVGESAEHACHICAPEGVTFSSMKIPFPDYTPQGLSALIDGLEETAGRFRGYDLDLLVFGCEAGSSFRGRGFDETCAVMVEKASGIPGLSSGTATLEALRALGSRRIAVLTAYPDVTNELEKEFLEANGFEVSSITGMDMSQFIERGRTHEAASEHFLYQYARGVDLGGADTFFLCGVELATMEIIRSLETDLDVPVITSQQATLWSALRHCEVGAKLSNFGKLFTL